MIKKIPFQNRIIAFILSILFALCLLLSLFALPIEFVFFNQQSYADIVENEEYVEVLPKILAETLVYQTSHSSQPVTIDLVSNKDNVVPIVAKNIPEEMIQSSFTAVGEQILAYLNFKIPASDMKVDISEIKAALIAESEAISADYLATFPNCLASEVDTIDLDADITALELPVCKPSGKNLSKFEQLWQAAFEDTFNSLPASISIDSILTFDKLMTDQYFYYYSLVRWVFRLLPIVTIILLTFTAVLLRNQREVMWKWCGRLLVAVSGVTLLGLVILLIGFDQFVAMMLNPFLKNLVTGFGYVVLGVAQDLGFKTLIWVLLSALIIMGFGIFLLLAGKFIKPKKVERASESQELIEEPELEEIVPDDPVMEKAVVPETLEEIEEEEKKRAENEKDDES